MHVRFKVTNTGNVAGKDVPQVYVAPLAAKWEAPKRLAGWDKVALQPGESKDVDVVIEPRILGRLGGGLVADIRPSSLALRREVLARRVADMPEGMWETYGPGATGVGWDGGLLGLGLHLGATEGSLAPGEAEAWAMTEEGKAFYRGAADGWAVAQVADGADPELAARNADATYAFYTGAAM